MKTMKLAACAAMALAAVASGQTTPTSASYEIRLVPNAGSGLGSAGGSVVTSTVTFVVQARATTAAGTTNYGVNQWANGSIVATSMSPDGPGIATITRASSSSAAAFGRFRSLASGGAQNFARFRSAAGTGGTSATGADANNVNGVLSGNSITGIEAHRGFAWTPIVAPLDPDTSEPTFGPGDAAANPWGGTNAGAIGGPITNGSAGAWQSLYAFTWTVPGPAVWGVTTITLGGSLNIASSIAYSNGSWTFDQLSNATPVSSLAGSTYTFWGPVSIIPTPGAAALLGLGGLAAARRRR